MTAFAIVATLMVATAVAAVLVPLLRRPGGQRVDSDASNVAILRDQLRELEADRTRGTISEANYAQAKEELERRVLEDVATGARAGRASQGGTPWIAAVVAGIIPVAAILLYLAVGSPEALAPQARQGAGAGPHEFSQEQVEQMVAGLAARLEKEPDNLEGWVVLARSYYVMKRFGDAARAYERVVALAPADADLLADYADTLAAAQQGDLSGKPIEMVKQALKVDPTHWKALALAGTEAFNRKDYKAAVAYWEKLRAAAPPGSPIAQSVEASIAEARELGGLKPTGPAVAAATAATGARIVGTVALGAAVQGKVAPTDTVFVFARAADGPRMPLAIVRRQVKDLPFEFSLDDSMAMTPAMKLSSFPEIVVGARVSRSGNAAPQSGDLEGLSKPVKVGATGVAIVIDTAVP